MAPEPMVMVFSPSPLSDAQMTEPCLKRAALGVALLGHFTALPLDAATVVWEVEMCMEPPAKLRPVKPKLWLAGSVQMESGVYYLLG